MPLLPPGAQLGVGLLGPLGSWTQTHGLLMLFRFFVGFSAKYLRTQDQRMVGGKHVPIAQSFSFCFRR